MANSLTELARRNDELEQRHQNLARRRAVERKTAKQTTEELVHGALASVTGAAVVVTNAAAQTQLGMSGIRPGGVPLDAIVGLSFDAAGTIASAFGYAMGKYLSATGKALFLPALDRETRIAVVSANAGGAQ